jgi:hypothetical protein
MMTQVTKVELMLDWGQGHHNSVTSELFNFARRIPPSMGGFAMLKKCAVLATSMIFGFGVPVANATTATLANSGAGGSIDFPPTPLSVS